jgi:outer membrane protein assembly factor BamB
VAQPADLPLLAPVAAVHKTPGSELAVPALVVALQDPSEAVRGAAAEVLQRLDPAAAGRAGLLPVVALDRNGGRLVCRDAAGREQWSWPLEGYVGPLLSPEPDFAWDAERVYVSYKDDLLALDRATGLVTWHARSPARGLCVSGELLLATDGPTFYARSAATGWVVFAVRLPTENRWFSPQPVREVGGQFLVQTEADGGEAFLLAREGQVRHRFDRLVLTGRFVDDDRVFLTSREVAGLTPRGQVAWSVPLRDPQPAVAGDVRQLPSGGVLAFVYSPTEDSGVQVLRIDSTTGRQLWQTFCAPLAFVPQSGYSHRAFVAVEGDRVRVTSCGSHGNFVEVLDLATGRQLSRRRY